MWQYTPPSESREPSGNILQSASHVVITGGSFVVGSQNVTTTANEPNKSLQLIYERAAPNAILNAGGRADAVRCCPGTREEVLAKIEAWIASAKVANGRERGIFWLSGPAGAGKSAIVQTLAERCLARGVPTANFFFFRGDVTRLRSFSSWHQCISNRFEILLFIDKNPVSDSLLTAFCIIDYVYEPTPSITEALIACRPHFDWNSRGIWFGPFLNWFLRDLEKLYCKRNNHPYELILQDWLIWLRDMDYILLDKDLDDVELAHAIWKKITAPKVSLLTGEMSSAPKSPTSGHYRRTATKAVAAIPSTAASGSATKRPRARSDPRLSTCYSASEINYNYRFTVLKPTLIALTMLR
ncbi:hypothetical protein D9619_004477 [Psilocybe cf. subviscida]|uniref:Nephrocystin 3-like N-terminal domain-containing protein n=1 Tax=Psilocybe cf. subviscida TaxID=2480587 RepID=A0A8H5BNP9_9AGAR|nr:hypothetical protein D9619_004477 [Psilocybe cf. subviscida]